MSLRRSGSGSWTSRDTGSNPVCASLSRLAPGERRDDRDRGDRGGGADEIQRDAGAEPQRRRGEDQAAARDGGEGERDDQAGAALVQALGVVDPAAQLERPVRELGDREEPCGIERRPLVDLAAADAPRVCTREDDERPRDERRHPERRDDEEQERDAAEHEQRQLVRVRAQDDRRADARGDEHRGERGRYARAYLACRLNAPTSANAPSSGTSGRHSTTGTPKRS